MAADLAPSLLQLDQQLQATAGSGRAVADGALQARLDSLQAALQADRGERQPDAVAAQRQKAERLLEFGRQWLQQPDLVAPDALPAARVLHRADTELGRSCATAIRIAAGDARQLAVAAGEALWFRIDLPRVHGLRVSTRGSTVDARLAAWADCRDIEQAPIASADDSFGLQADLAVPAARQSFWMVRLEHAGAQGGNVSMAAALAAVVSGTVRRDSDSAPLPSRRVAAFVLGTGSPQYFTDAFTDAQGNYTLALFGPGSFALRTGLGFSDGSNVVDEAYEDRTCRDNSPFNLGGCGTTAHPYTPIVLAEPDSRTIDFRLQASPVLLGTVVSSTTGAPLRDAQVRVVNTQGSTLRSAFTDVAGRYRFEGLAPDTVFVTASAADHAGEVFENVPCEGGFSCNLLGATPIQLVAEQSQRVDFELLRRQAIDVQLTLDGQPVGSPFFARLSLLNANGAEIATASTATGTARIGPLVPGSYRLRVSSEQAFPQLYDGIECATDCLAELPLATLLQVPVGSTITTVSMDLRGYPQLQGRLTSAGNGAPIANAQVHLIHPNGFSSLVETPSDAGGNYRFRGVAPGTYLLHFRSGEYTDELHDNVPCQSTNPQLDCPGATLLSFSASSADRTIDAQLERGGSIRGRVTRSNGSFSSSLELYLLRLDGSLVRVYSMFGASSGSEYTLADILPGSYRLVAYGFDGLAQIYPFSDCAPGTSSVYSGCSLAASQVINVGGGEVVSGIDFSLRGSGARPVRVLSASNGQPLAGVAVDLWRSDFSRVDTALTNADGLAYVALPSFSSPALTYLSTDNRFGLLDEVYDDRPCPAGSAYFGLCALAGGTTVPMPADLGAAATVITLADPGAVFGNGFESP